MTDDILNVNMTYVHGKKKLPVLYEHRRVKGKERQTLNVRMSKKGGSSYSNMFLDLVYLVGKIDPDWMDKLVNDKEFFVFLEQMNNAYVNSNKHLFHEGWSNETVKELLTYKEKGSKKE